MLKEIKSASTLILAAGESSRMGVPKPFLKFDKQHLFIDKIINEYLDFGCNEIVVVTNKNLEKDYFSKDKVKIVINEHLEYGRFYSVKIGVKELSNEFCFIQNIDNPFVCQDILNLLFIEKNNADYLVPEFEHIGGHPVLIGKNIIDGLKIELNNDLNFRDFLKSFDCKRIECYDKNILININTPEDYKEYFS